MYAPRCGVYALTIGALYAIHRCMRNKTALIIEDDENVGLLLKHLLESEHLEVFTAPNGKDALDLLTVIEQPCIIFCDVMMPVMDGKIFTETLRKNSVIAAIPIIIMSGTEKAPEGANKFIKKPFALDAILQIVRQYCGQDRS